VASAGNGSASSPVVARVRGTTITKTAYDHWFAVGAATVERPKSGHPIPRPIKYEPPTFAACVANLSRSHRSSRLNLRSTCQRTYEDIKARVLNFLITGLWLRGEATAHGASVSRADVREKFAEERHAHFPTSEAFRRLQSASHQTVADLEFATETQLLSSKLLAAFAKTHGEENEEQNAIAGFNTSLRHRWIPRTDCEPDYVVPDCAQYRPPGNAEGPK
jgi:hypothetical protein